jgi:quercetin dioxygenase-like cupin family protein
MECRRRAGGLPALWISALSGIVLGLAQGAVAAPPGPSVETLIDTSETVLGQEFVYPEGRARITTAVVTVPPGALLASHLHPVPVFGYMLQGELIVDYGSAGERVYRAGDALVEAFDWPHQGRNGGRGVVKILVVYAGAEGVANTEPAELE